MKSLIFILTVGSLLGANGVMARQHELAAEKGDWRPAPTQNINFNKAGYWGFPKQLQLDMRANMAKVMEVIHQTPMLYPPKGYSVGTYAVLCEYGCEGKKVIAGESGAIFLEYSRVSSSAPVKTDQEGPSLNVHFNHIGRLLSNKGVDPEAVFDEPEIDGYTQGFPIYGKFVVITKRKEPLFIPITREHKLKLDIAEAKEWERADQLAKLEKELAALTPEQKKETVIGYNKRTLVRVNPNFYDPKLPASAVQLVLIDLYKYQKGTRLYDQTFCDHEKALVNGIRETLDLLKIQSVLP